MDLLQWPAMAVTLVASWLVTSTQRGRRIVAFTLFVLSNVLWVLWAAYARAYALIVLQIGLGILNTWGIAKNEARHPGDTAVPQPLDTVGRPAAWRDAP